MVYFCRKSMKCKYNMFSLMIYAIPVSNEIVDMMKEVAPFYICI